MSLELQLSLYCNIMYCTLLYYIILYCTLMYFTVYYYTTLHCTLLHCTILYWSYIVQFEIWFFAIQSNISRRAVRPWVKYYSVLQKIRSQIGQYRQYIHFEVYWTGSSQLNHFNISYGAAITNRSFSIFNLLEHFNI